MPAPYNVTGMPEAAASVMAMMRATDPEGAAAALRGRAERPDYRPAPAPLSSSVPCLVLVGADDVHTPVAEAEALHALVPHSRPIVIDRAGHLPGCGAPGGLRPGVARVPRVPRGPSGRGPSGPVNRYPTGPPGRASVLVK